MISSCDRDGIRAKSAGILRWDRYGFRYVLRTLVVAIALGMPTAARAAEEVNAVFVMKVDGSEVRQLAKVDPSAVHDNPRWSHDGKRVAFDVRMSDTKVRKIYKVDADGTNLQELGPHSMPDWSPDDKQVVAHHFLGGSEAPEVYAINADGQGQERVALGRSPRWSPDGSKLALSDLTMLRTVDLLSGEEVKLLEQPVEQIFSGFNWSPDGKKLAVIVRPKAGAKRDLLILDARGAKFGRHLRMTRTVGGVLDWSPDGKQLAINIDYQLYLVDVDGKAKTRLIPGQTGKNQSPAWSPDGKQLVFVSDRK